MSPRSEGQMWVSSLDLLTLLDACFVGAEFGVMVRACSDCRHAIKNKDEIKASLVTIEGPVVLRLFIQIRPQIRRRERLPAMETRSALKFK